MALLSSGETYRKAGDYKVPFQESAILRSQYRLRGYYLAFVG